MQRRFKHFNQKVKEYLVHDSLKKDLVSYEKAWLFIKVLSIYIAGILATSNYLYQEYFSINLYYDLFFLILLVSIFLFIRKGKTWIPILGMILFSANYCYEQIFVFNELRVSVFMNLLLVILVIKVFGTEKLFAVAITSVVLFLIFLIFQYNNEKLNTTFNFSQSQTIYRYAFLSLSIIYIVYGQEKIFKKLESELRTAVAEVNGMVSMAVHDLKSPLNRIDGLQSVLKQHSVEGDEKKEIMQLISNETTHMKALVDDVLLASKNAGDEKPKYSHFVLKNVIKDKVNQFRNMAEEKGIELVQEDPVFDFGVVSDPTYLERILENIISNAIKYSNRGKRVWVRYWQIEGGFFFEVEDEGPGISEHDQKKMFRMFQKLSAQPTAGEDSHGIGLAIVHTLTNKLNGKIIVESELKRGTFFRFEFKNGEVDYTS